MTDWYDRDGHPISMWRANELHGDMDYKRVAQDMFVFDGEPVHISTVWLGLNHNWGDGSPLIFETMIFGGTHDGAQWRYSTEEQAHKGHADAVTVLQLEQAAKEA